MNDEGTFPLSWDTVSAHLTLDEVAIRLAAHPEIVAIVALGSAADGTMTVASDYDLLVILHDAPAPMTLILTRIEQRVAEVVLMAGHELQRILHHLPTRPEGSSEVGLARRLADGRILFDRGGMLAQAQSMARTTLPQLSVSEAQRYVAWFNINYSLRMLIPMLMADDPAHRFAVRYRLHAQIGDLCVRYFTVRDLPWRGEKAAYRHWQRHDPAFLALLETFLAESNGREKANTYRELARHALAPVGGIWDESAVVADAPAEHVEEMLKRWDSLLQVQ